MNYLRPVLLFFAALLGLAGCQSQPSTPVPFTNWPAGTSPAEVGKRVAENFAAAVWRVTNCRPMSICPPT